MPHNLTKELKQVGLDAGASMVGVADISTLHEISPQGDPRKFLRGARYVVVAAVADPPGLASATDMQSFSAMAMPGYLRADGAVRAMISFLRRDDIGGNFIPPKVLYAIDARGVLSKNISLKHAAVAAGIGEIGRHTLVVTRKYGPRIRLAAFATRAELEADSPLNEKLCSDCGACGVACPSGAIQSGENFDAGRCATYLTAGVNVDDVLKTARTMDPADIQRQISLASGAARGWLQSFASMRPLYYHCGNCMKVCKKKSAPQSESA